MTSRMRIGAGIAALAITATAFGSQVARAQELPGAVTDIDVVQAQANQWDLVDVKATFVIPSNAVAGDTLTMTLPDVFKPFTDSFDVVDPPTGDVVGRATVVGNSVVVTLTDYVEIHENIAGTLKFNAQVTQVVTPGVPVDLEFEAGGKVFRDQIIVGVGTPGTSTPTDAHKSMWWTNGGVQDSNGSTASVTFVIESPTTTMNDSTVTLTDIPGNGLIVACDSPTMPTLGSVAIADVVGGVPDWDQAVWISSADQTAGVTCSPDKASVTMTGIGKNKVVRFEGRNTVTDHLQSYTNDATVDINGVTTPTQAWVERFAGSGEGSGTTPTPTATPSDTPSATPSETPSETSMATPSDTPTPTATPSSDQPSTVTTTATAKASTSQGTASGTPSKGVPLARTGGQATDGGATLLLALGAAAALVGAGAARRR